MRAIYEPRGRAREYCELATNLYRGCGHGCVYCYAPYILRMKRDEFITTQLRLGVLHALERDAPRYVGREVLLCFTTDPYHPDERGETRKAIQILQHAGCRVVILTKGGLRSLDDLKILRPGVDRYGATLTFVDQDDSRTWEPNAATPKSRMDVLKKAKSIGIETWASLEPVIYPEQSLELIKMTAGFVDVYKIGKWNYDKRAKEIDWGNFVTQAVKACEEQGSKHILKEDLREYLCNPRT